jgi:hypothetical protein
MSDATGKTARSTFAPPAYTPAEWGLFEAIEVLLSAMIRRGADGQMMAEAFSERVRHILDAGGDSEAAFAKALPLSQLAESCLNSHVRAGHRGVIRQQQGPGDVLTSPVRPVTG